MNGSYLYFTRVDKYHDFPGADMNDGKQLPLDLSGNKASKFAKVPTFSAADAYDKSRERSYACCFSLENSKHIWQQYGNNENGANEKGKVCCVFNFGKLRSMLNNNFKKFAIIFGDQICDQIFFLNYGAVEYVDIKKVQANKEKLVNPIKYLYFKDNTFIKENELRISLSSFGVGEFVINKSVVSFPNNLQLPFDFKKAIASGVIQRIECDSSCCAGFLQAELPAFEFAAIPGNI
ncbi:MAG: DUF2971 domain-containing protein [Gammaproteobacteria bacterium]|nr:DUF2971 domain-containing protein [Gammaproteobacteria bacterium]